MPESKKPEITRDSTLVEKLAWIISDLPQLQKRGWNAGQKFNFISVEQMKREVLPRCADLGIIMFPKAIDRALNYRERFRDGNVIGLSTEVQLTMTWAITDGSDTIEVQTVGEALDVQDKAANKASTGAQKNLFKTVFGVTEADEDNDAYTPVPGGESTRPAQRQQAPPKRQLTDAQKEILALKDEAGKTLKVVADEKMVTPQAVIVQMIRDEAIPAEWVDSKAIKHRDEYRKLIEATKTYLDTSGDPDKPEDPS